MAPINLTKAQFNHADESKVLARIYRAFSMLQAASDNIASLQSLIGDSPSALYAPEALAYANAKIGHMAHYVDILSANIMRAQNHVNAEWRQPPRVAYSPPVAVVSDDWEADD